MGTVQNHEPKQDAVDIESDNERLFVKGDEAKERKQLIFWLVGIFILGIGLIAISILTRFRNSNSFWSLPLGVAFIVFGIVLASAQKKIDKKKKSREQNRN